MAVTPAAPPSKRLSMKKVDRLLLRRGIVERGSNSVFFTDVITESALQKYSRLVMQEASTLTKYICENWDLALKSIDDMKEHRQRMAMTPSVSLDGRIGVDLK